MAARDWNISGIDSRDHHLSRMEAHCYEAVIAAEVQRLLKRERVQDDSAGRCRRSRTQRREAQQKRA